MLWLAIVLLTSLAIAMSRGGRFTHLGDIELKAWWLLVVSFGLQAGARWAPAAQAWESAGLTMILTSFALLMAMALVNRSKPGMRLAGLGVLANFAVIAANGGMPVLAGAAEVASGFAVNDLDLSVSFTHVLLDETSRLTFFADVIPLRIAGFGEVISFGDVFLAIGLGVFLEHELRRPRRWFRHGVSAVPGSAARQR